MGTNEEDKLIGIDLFFNIELGQNTRVMLIWDRTLSRDGTLNFYCKLVSVNNLKLHVETTELYIEILHQQNPSSKEFYPKIMINVSACRVATYSTLSFPCSTATASNRPNMWYS